MNSEDSQHALYKGTCCAKLLQLCNLIEGLLPSNSRLLFVFLTDQNREEKMKNILLFYRLQRHCGSLQTHCVGPQII